VNWTIGELYRRGHDTRPLAKAFSLAFDQARAASDVAVSLFWDQFVAAHRAIRRNDRRAAA
jgi:hypothetical protein